MKRLIPPDDCPEEIARRLDVIQQHRALNAILGVRSCSSSQRGILTARWTSTVHDLMKGTKLR